MKNTALRLSLLLLCLLCTSLHAHAQKQYIIYGGLYDALTRTTLRDAKVTLLRPDSTAVDSMTITDTHCVDRFPAWYFTVPAEMPAYLVRFEREDYETAYLSIPAHRFAGRHNAKLFDAYIRPLPKTQHLGEATVRATKLKFYTKKDTLVFNADAFILAEGSMLDALIEQLPGVELHDNGNITVNGRHVESLLLNGEDLFKGKNQLVLDNISSYMVKTVQVYEKEDDTGRMAGRKTGQEEYVMDVKLKKQYSIGWIANAEAGYSTEDHYLGRLFGLRYTPQSRLTVIANVNNVNDNRRPGQHNEWTPAQMPDGTLTTHMAAAEYLVKDKEQRYQLSGDIYADRSDADKLTQSAQETFLPDGNTFGRSMRRSTSRNLSLNTAHKLKYMSGNRLTLLLQPRLAYRHWRNASESAAATFAALPGLTTSQLLDSIRSPQAGALLRRLAVNRTLTEAMDNGSRLDGGATFTGTLKIGADLLQIKAAANYARQHSDDFNHYRLDFPANAAAAPDYRNRWTAGSPDHNLNLSAGADYSLWLGRQLLLRPSYGLAHQRSTRDSRLYRLDRLAGWDENADATLGLLPSDAEQLAHALDTENSYHRHQTDTRHTVSLYLKDDRYMHDEDACLHYDITLPLTATRSHLDYRRHEYDGVTSRTTLFFNPSATIYYKWHGQQRNVQLSYFLTHSAPDMLDLLDLENSADPLRIYHGNPLLANAASHDLRLYHSNNSPRLQRSFYTSVRYRATQRAQAWGYVYDRATGVRHYTASNIDGNYTLSANLSFDTPLDRARRLTLNTYTYAQLNHGADLISTTDGLAPARSSTTTYWATETLRLEYRAGRVKAGAKVYASWNRPTSRRADFTAFTVWDLNYGPTVQIELPWDLQLTTDLTLYSRRGYADAAANTDDLVWNARLAKRTLRGRLTFTLDAFDILGQLSNLTQTISAQGHFETWRSVTPRYVMLHAIYRFSVNPKK